MKLSATTIGVINEHKAAIWLLEQGFHVFTNVCGTGPADLVAWNSNTQECWLIDVKTCHEYIKQTGEVTIMSSLYSTHIKHPQVKYLGFIVESNEFIWL